MIAVTIVTKVNAKTVVAYMLVVTVDTELTVVTVVKNMNKV